MKASVQYNDFIGTAAADISDYTGLSQFIASRNVDTEKYDAIGVELHANYGDSFSASFICVDKEQSTNEKKPLVKIRFEAAISKEEFFDLFKRFNVVLTSGHKSFTT